MSLLKLEMKHPFLYNWYHSWMRHLKKNEFSGPHMTTLRLLLPSQQRKQVMFTFLSVLAFWYLVIPRVSQLKTCGMKLKRSAELLLFAWASNRKELMDIILMQKLFLDLLFLFSLICSLRKECLKIIIHNVHCLI